MQLDQVKSLAEKIKNNISKVIIGKDDIAELVVMSVMCSGHVLLEDVPGVGKTVLAKCLARSVSSSFKRVQFTPDLLPSDLTGINYFDQKESKFQFRPGPLFANILLADEINRATPRTQASLLECMEEGQVTVDGVTRRLESPFFVIATQNPVETRGTFPLPEAQMDRFFMRLSMGYPSASEGRDILDRFQEKNPLPELSSVVEAKEITEAQSSFGQVYVSREVKDYIIEIIEATRKSDKALLGVSPRGSLALLKAAQICAVMRSRDFVTPDDVKYMAVPVLAHRIILKGNAAISNTASAEKFITEILDKVPAPVEELQR